MGCLLAGFAGFFPRVGLVALWAFTNEVDRAYDSFLLPLLGLAVGLALVLDLSSFGGGARARGRRD